MMEPSTHMAGDDERPPSRLSGNLLAAALVVIVVLAPLPLGGNRPFLWPAWTFLVGITATAYAAYLLMRRRGLAVPLASFAWPGFVFAAICGYLLVQCLPIARVLGLGQIGPPPGIETPFLSIAPGQTVLMLVRWLGYGLLFLLAAQVSASRSRAILMVEAVYFALVFYGLLGLVQLGFFGDTLLGLNKWAYNGFATGTFVNRNSYATYLAFGLAIGTALLTTGLVPSGTEPQRRGWLQKRGTIGLYLASLGVILAALFASGSRMGLFAGLLGSAVVFGLALFRRERSTQASFLVPIAGLAGGLLILVAFGGALLDRVSGIENDAESRLELYRQVWAMTLQRPFTGFGGGAFELAFQMFRGPPLGNDVVWDKAHSTYLTLAAELGLPVALLALALVGGLSARVTTLLRNPNGGRRIALAVTGVLVVAATHSLVDFSLEIQANAYLFVMLLGIGFGYAQTVPRHTTGSP
ncbi:MAG: O-antigen ligase family protein [Devosia sp.]